ncbi:MAG: hypothetical protein P8N29_04500 [Saprospiraceae bacterium]|nr:hypothetical protein [Saprospiraceae bacterium]
MYAVKINNQLNEAEYNLYLIIAAERILENIDHKIYIFEHDIRSQVKKTKETGSGQRLYKNGIYSLFKKVLDDHEQQLETETALKNRIASKIQPLVDGILDK